MLPQEIIDEARRLLSQPLKQRPSMRAIARKLKISHTIVQRMDRGYRTSRYRRKSQQRCPGCGGMVRMPCVKCAADAEPKGLLAYA